MKQPTFDWIAKDKYIELKNFEMEVMNILMTNKYSLRKTENVPIIKKWLGRTGLQFTHTQKGKVRCIEL